MIIQNYPTKPEYKEIKDNKKQWRLVGNFLNRRAQFVDDKQPFSDFVKIVNLRNDTLHYTLEFKPPVADITPLYNSYRYENAELAVKTINSMVEHLSENSLLIHHHQWLH
jgi:predicted metallo-beta-lactamase superfamily hydrolase